MPRSSILSNPPSSIRVPNLVRRRFRPLLKPSHPLHNVLRPFILLVALVPLYFLIIHIHRHRPSSFDDISDMLAVVDRDHHFLIDLHNRSSSSSLHSSNLLISQSRIAFHRILSSLTHRPVRPTLTKYKKRLLMQLVQNASLQLSPALLPTLHVTCNYVNHAPLPTLNTSTQPSFSCMHTSHRCPDGSFSPTFAFSPKEGPSVTWADVVIIMLVSEGRNNHLQAVAETWLVKLPPEAHIVLVRDGPYPPIPSIIMARPNTQIFEYNGATGMHQLDMKAARAWAFVYTHFLPLGKKYFIKVDDDTFLFSHNLMRFLNHLEQRFSPYEHALYFGHPFCGHGNLHALNYSHYCYAGGGAYGLSLEALYILLRQLEGGCAYFYDYVAKAPNMRPENDQYGGRYEDVMIGRCLRQARTRSQQTGVSLLACGSFIPYAPLHYYQRFGRTKKALANKLDGDAITVHNLDPSAMYFLDRFISEYPLNGDIGPFSLKNERLQLLIDKCSMNGKKMHCDLS